MNCIKLNHQTPRKMRVWKCLHELQPPMRDCCLKESLNGYWIQARVSELETVDILYHVTVQSAYDASLFLEPYIIMIVIPRCQLQTSFYF
jgi:hypothetical protein